MTAALFFENLQKQFDAKLPFVAYRKPNEYATKGILQSDDSLHEITNFTESGFVFAPFNEAEKTILIPFQGSQRIETRIPSGQEHSNKKALYQQIEMPSTEVKENHMALVEKAIKEIESGVFQKVVVSRKEQVSLENLDLISLFIKLLDTYDRAFVYIWYHPRVGLWLGATPETLLKINGNQLSTMALAGTQQYADSMTVAWGTKELDEQELVTDFIMSSLQAELKNIKRSEVTTVKAGNLLHLKTEISGRLSSSESDYKQLIRSLHPTPAICGMPRDKAKQFILDHEGYPRAFYTGFLGELNAKETAARNRNTRNIENNAYRTVKNNTDLYVNLRCMQLKNNQAIIYVGGGITKDSVPELEWEETMNKANTMKKVL